MTPVNSHQERVTVRARQLNGRYKQQGLTFPELLIAIAIGIIFLMNVPSMFSKGSVVANNSVENDNIQSLITSIRGLRTSSGYGASGTDLMPSLLNSGGVPESMTKPTTTTLANTWGGSITAVSTGTGYTLTYSGVPRANCVQLAIRTPSNLSLSINSGSAITGEVTTAAANSGCSNDSNSLAWSGR